jgi:hypothetical protein
VGTDSAELGEGGSGGRPEAVAKSFGNTPAEVLLVLLLLLFLLFLLLLVLLLLVLLVLR